MDAQQAIHCLQAILRSSEEHAVSQTPPDGPASAAEHPIEQLRQECARLDAERARLAQRCQELEAERESAAAHRKAASGLVLWLGIRLLRLQTIEKALVNLIAAVREKNTFPTEETAAVVAAIVRRVLWIGTVGVFVALIPQFLSLWQIALLREQSRDQATSNYIERKADLLQTLYQEDCQSDNGPPLETARCRPAQPWRIRRQAVLSLLALDRAHDEESPDLSGARLDDLPLSGADFSGAWLSNAVLERSQLVNANLDNVDAVQIDMSYARMQGVSMQGALLDEAIAVRADLSRANLLKVHLVLADLTDADFTKSKLRGAVLWGADLSGADFTDADLTDAEFEKKDSSTTIQYGPGYRDTLFGIDRKEAHHTRKYACYSEQTVWPNGFEPDKFGLVICSETAQ
jgi:uncharacterized protein YjbI with pentapeptide repeats